MPFPVVLLVSARGGVGERFRLWVVVVVDDGKAAAVAATPEESRTGSSSSPGMTLGEGDRSFVSI